MQPASPHIVFIPIPVHTYTLALINHLLGLLCSLVGWIMQGQDVCFGRESKELTVFSVCFFLYSLKSFYRFWSLYRKQLISVWVVITQVSLLLCLFVFLSRAVIFQGLNVVWDFVLNNIKWIVKKCRFQSVTRVSAQSLECFLFLPWYKWKFM